VCNLIRLFSHPTKRTISFLTQLKEQEMKELQDKEILLIMPTIAQLTNSCASFKASKQTFASSFKYNLLEHLNSCQLNSPENRKNAFAIIESHKMWSFAML
jgi:hypothetical protein